MNESTLLINLDLQVCTNLVSYIYMVYIWTPEHCIMIWVGRLPFTDHQYACCGEIDFNIWSCDHLHVHIQYLVIIISKYFTICFIDPHNTPAIRPPPHTTHDPVSAHTSHHSCSCRTRRIYWIIYILYHTVPVQYSRI